MLIALKESGRWTDRETDIQTDRHMPSATFLYFPEMNTSLKKSTGNVRKVAFGAETQCWSYAYFTFNSDCYICILYPHSVDGRAGSGDSY